MSLAGHLLSEPRNRLRLSFHAFGIFDEQSKLYCLATFTGIKACMEAMDHVDEEKYEITVDVHGVRDGPRLGRLRVLNMVNL